MSLLESYDWPGNVRELSNAIERALVVGRGTEILPEDLPLRNRVREGDAPDSLAELERRHVAAILARTQWNITRTAELLGVDRATVYNKIKKYQLVP
jgi:DNA-binding NtrC family response regulator